MLPSLRPRDWVTIRLTDPERVRLGDIVAFRQGDRVVVHRCVGWKMVGGERWFCEKGEGQATWRWIPENRLAGRMETLDRDGQTRDMRKWPWSPLNRMIGFAWALSIKAIERRAHNGRDEAFHDKEPQTGPTGPGARLAVKALNRTGRFVLSLADRLADLGQHGHTSSRSFTRLSPEERLLVLTSRLVLSPDETGTMRSLLSQPLDWSLLQDRSETLCIRPILFLHLSGEEFRSFVPSHVMAGLEQDYRTQSMKNLRLFGQLSKILKAFEEVEIPVVPLKGALLAGALYKDIGLRPMSDVDLLCRETDHDRARERILALGFAKKVTFVSPLHEQLWGARHGSHPPALYHPGKGKIEIHLNIFPKVPHKPEDMKSVWAGTVPWTLDGRSCRSLSVEDQLLHLTLHLEQHRVSGTATLVWFCDIHEFIGKHGPDIRWEGFIERVESLGVSTQVGNILGLLKEHWKTPLPEWIPGRLGGVWDERVLAATIRRQEDTAALAKRLRSNYLGRLLQIREIEGWRRQLSYLIRFFIPTTEYLRQAYDLGEDRSVWPFYLHHPLLKMGRLAKRLPLLLHAPSRSGAKAGDGRG